MDCLKLGALESCGCYLANGVILFLRGSGLADLGIKEAVLDGTADFLGGGTFLACYFLTDGAFFYANFLADGAFLMALLLAFLATFLVGLAADFGLTSVIF